MDECLTQRQEEALALAAIYGERFSERIANAVWTVKLDLPFLSGSAVGQGGGDGNQRAKAQKACQFYLKGKGCRFGDKCKFKHQPVTKERPAGGPPDPNGPSQPGFSSYSPPEYELEIRFPKGNRYPFQAPIVAFGTTDESVGAAGRLGVTERLFAEALAAAESGEPVVYTLITLCEDETVMRELLAVGHHKYSTPPPPVAAARLPPPAIAKSKSARSNASEESRSGSGGNRATGRKSVTLNNNRAIDGEFVFTIYCCHSPNRAVTQICKSGFTSEERAEAEEEEDEDEAVPVENESYVNLRKKTVQKHSLKTDNVLQESGKLCREFQRKQVSESRSESHKLLTRTWSQCLRSRSSRAQSSRRFASMLEQRRKLPAWQERENILGMLERSQVLVVSGMTGWVTWLYFLRT